jgi:GDPmannose 4,6-dehydratase
MILQSKKPEDWVIATGKTTKIRDFVRMAFNNVGIELQFSGSGVDEVAKVIKCKNPSYRLKIGKEVLAVDPKYFRPTEVDLLIGNPKKAKEKLGWEPRIQLKELVKEMMEADLKLARQGKYLEEGGYESQNYFEL